MRHTKLHIVSSRGCSTALIVLLSGTSATTSAATEAECKAKCPNIKPPAKSWTTTVGDVQCVEYANYRSKLKHSGDAWTWAQYPPCTGEPGVTCIQKKPEPGTVLVSQPLQNGSHGAGHVAVVDCVIGDWVKVAEYNWAIPGQFSGDRCINVKDAEDRDTAFAFVRVKGELFPAEGEYCESPVAIASAFVHPDPNDVKKGEVDIDFSASACSRAKWTLSREVYKVVGATRTRLDEHSWSKPVENVLEHYKDTFSAVPACSEFVYTLQRSMQTGPIIGPPVVKSAPRTGVNLQAPADFFVDPVDKVYGQVLLRWPSACTNYVGKAKTKYVIEYTRGQGATSKLGPTEATVIAGVSPESRKLLVTNLFGASSYVFSIRTNNDGDVSATAVERLFTTKAPNNTTPAPLPQRPTLTMRCQEGKLGAKWLAPDGAEGYELQLIAPGKPAPAPQLFAAPGTSLDLPAPIDGPYTVRLRSLRGGKPSAWTDPVIYPRDCVPEPPAVALPVNDECGGVKLTWKADPLATPAHLKRWEVVRRESGSAQWIPIARLLPNVLTYTDVEARPDKQYMYSVRAGYETPEGKQLLSPPAEPYGPIAPNSPPFSPEIARVKTLVDRVAVDFTDQALNETEFVVKRWTDNETGALAQFRLPGKSGTGAIAWIEPSTLPYENRSYRYKIFAVKGACKESPVSASLPVEARRLVAPIVSVKPDTLGPKISWTDKNLKVTGYEVFRKKLTDIAWPTEPMSTVPKGALSVADLDNVDAQYAVRALYEGDRTASVGPMSTPVTYLKQATPDCGAVGNLPVLTRVTNLEDPRRSKLEFTYDAGPTFVTRVEFARPNQAFVPLMETTTKSGTIEVDVGLFMNQQISLRLVGVDKAKSCKSKPSAAHLVYPLPAPVGLPSVTGDKSCAQGVMVKWVDTSTYGTKFQVEWKPDDAASWQKMDKENYFRITGKKEVWQCHTPMPAPNSNRYRVRSTYHVMKNGQPDVLSTSLWSNEASAPDPSGDPLELANAGFELTNQNGKPGDRLISWGPGGAWATHLEHPKPGNTGLGARFGYYAAGSETVGQITAAKFAAGKTYTFKGRAHGGGDDSGKVPFQLGYVTDPSDLTTFQPLSTKLFAVGGTWTAVAGASYTVKVGEVAVGKRIAVRLGSGANGGTSDVWFDDLALLVK